MSRQIKASTVKEKIQERINNALNAFTDEANAENISDDIIEKVKNAYYLDIKNFKFFPESFEFKTFNKKPNTDEDLAFYLLGKQLTHQYELFSKSSSRDRFIKEYFDAYKSYRCSICGQLLETKSKSDIPIADIDHLFPKEQYPQFAMHYENFIPTCKECNQTEKNTKSITPKEFKSALYELSITFKHPIKLWENLRLDFSNLTDIKLNVENQSSENQSSENAFKLIQLYGIDKRYRVVLKKCYNCLFCHIKNTDVRSPDSLEKLVESLVVANWETMNSDYSLNNYPQIWQEFLEWILYSESNLLALWDEVRDYSACIHNYSIV